MYQYLHCITGTIGRIYYMYIVVFILFLKASARVAVCWESTQRYVARVYVCVNCWHSYHCVECIGICVYVDNMNWFQTQLCVYICALCVCVSLHVCALCVYVCMWVCLHLWYPLNWYSELTTDFYHYFFSTDITPHHHHHHHHHHHSKKVVTNCSQP